MTARPFTLGFTAAVIASAVFGWWAVTGSSADPGVHVRPDDAALVALGGTVYAENCASCRGANLGGQPDWKRLGPDGRMPAPPHDETGHAWHHDDAMLFKLTKHGRAALLGSDFTYESAMPAHEGVLTDEEIPSVLSFIKSRWPADVRERHNAINERAAE